MSALIPYAGRYAAKRSIGALAMMGRRRKIPRTFYRVAGYGARMALRAGARRWKKRRGAKKTTRRARMAPNIKSAGKSVQPPNQPFYQNIKLRTLYSSPMPEAPPPTQANDFNVRERSTVTYKGYKICRQFENRGSGPAAIYEVNYAMIQFKNNITEGLTPLQIEALIRDKFFRETVSNTERSADFINASTSAQVWDATYNCNPMNPNKQYNIIFRKKFTLGPRKSNVNESRTFENFKKFDFYMPVKKRVQFAKRDSTANQTPFYEIWWYNSRGPADYPATDSQGVEVMKTLSHHFLYYSG
jgi:hypothetical protein